MSNMAPSLNDRQRRFAELVFKGNPHREAYISAGYAEKGADESASRLLRNAKVRGYLESLREDARNEVVYTALERMRLLTDIAKGGEDGSMSDRLRAIDLLNKMDGAYSPERHKLETDQVITVTIGGE